MGNSTKEKNDLPRGWVQTKLGEVCKILDSQRIPINSDERAKRIIGKSKNELFPYYGATGLVGYIDDFLFDGEYLLLGEDGAPFLESYKDKAYLVKGKFWVNNHAHILDALFSKAYLCHWLNQIDYREFVTGTTRLKLNQASMKEIPIILAPLPEQYSIVAKIEELFSELDKGVEALKTAQQQLKVYRHAVLKWAFEGKLTDEWRKQQKDLPTAEQLLEQITAEREEQAKAIGKKLKLEVPLTKEELAELPIPPDGWCWEKLADICYDISDGDHQPPPKANDGIPFVTISNIVNNEIDFKKTFYVSELYYKNLGYNRKPRKGDILYTVTGSFGVPVMINYEKQFCFQRHIGLVRPCGKINQTWLYYLLQAPIIFTQAQKVATGTAQKTVSLDGLRNFKIPIMSTKEQQQVVEQIESRLSVADKIEESITQSLKQAEAVRQSILKKAFSGKLRPQDPNDEPAEKLLARIRAEKALQTQENSTVKRRGAGRKTASSPKRAANTGFPLPRE